jgi:hypothetical protein
MRRPLIAWPVVRDIANEMMKPYRSPLGWTDEEAILQIAGLLGLKPAADFPFTADSSITGTSRQIGWEEVKK